MQTLLKRDHTVSRKTASDAETPKPDPKKQAGTLIRVSDDFANSIRRAAQFEDISIADFASRYLADVVERVYRDAVVKEAKRFDKK